MKLIVSCLIVAMVVSTPAVFGASLKVNNVNPIAGNYDLEVTAEGDSAAAYVETDTPNAETSINVEFKLMATDLDFGGGSNPGVRNLRIFKGISTFPAPGAAGAEHMVIFFKNSMDGSAAKRVRVMVATDAGFFASCAEFFFGFPNVTKMLRVEWEAGSGSFTSDARCSVYLDGQLMGQKTNLNFQDYNVDRVRFGFFQPTNAGTTVGSYRIDDVILTR